MLLNLNWFVALMVIQLQSNQSVENEKISIKLIEEEFKDSNDDENIIFSLFKKLNVPANILKEDLVESGLNVFDQKIINKYFTLIKSLNMIV
jgi:hypothetical protein